MQTETKEINLVRKRAYWLVNDPARKNQIRVNL